MGVKKRWVIIKAMVLEPGYAIECHLYSFFIQNGSKNVKWS